MNETDSPHWDMKEKYSLHAGLNVASFAHRDTKEESHGWITAQNEIYIGSFSKLPPLLQKNSIAPFSSFFQQVYETIFGYNADFQALLKCPPYHILHLLPQEIRFELFYAWCQEALKGTRLLAADYLAQFGYSHQNYNLLHVIKPLNVSPLQEILNFRTHQKNLPPLLSPFPPGLIAKAQHHICAKDFICYRFQNPIQKEIFYLIWSDNLDPAKDQPIFYAPSQALIIGNGVNINKIAAQILSWIIGFPEPKNFNSLPSDIEMDDYGIGKISHFWENVAHHASQPDHEKNHPSNWVQKHNPTPSLPSSHHHK